MFIKIIGTTLSIGLIMTAPSCDLLGLDELNVNTGIGTAITAINTSINKACLDANHEKITTAHELSSMLPDGNYCLENDINLTADWIPIGKYGSSTAPTSFAGQFNGLNHTITGLKINENNGSYLGLFAKTSETAEIRNIVIHNPQLTGDTIIGTVVGDNNGKIENVRVTGNTGKVVGTGDSIGGLVGINNNNGIIKDSISSASTEANNNEAGGLVGKNLNNIINCHATGNIKGEQKIGGLVGENNGGTITDSHSTGIVTGNAQIGGLIGMSTSGSITNSYATGKITGTGQSVGGLVGYNYDRGTITDSHADGDIEGTDHVGGLIGYNTGPITDSYATGDIEGTGGNVGGLAGNNHGPITNGYSTGIVKGTEDNVGGLAGNNGSSITNSHATGSAEGDGHVGGLIGYNTGPITDSHATGNIKGEQKIGGLVGYNYDRAKIDNSYATGSAEGDGNVGGLVGYNAGTIEDSHAVDGIIEAKNNVGGLAGYNANFGSIIGSHATGNTKGDGNVGGLAGYNAGIIEDSHAAGQITGTAQSVGGLIGYNSGFGGGAIGSVTESYATGDVEGTNDVAGLVGSSTGEIYNSYAIGNVKGTGNNAGGFVGRNSIRGSITNSYATGNVDGGTVVGGFIGEYASGTITNCYFDEIKTGRSKAVGNSVTTIDIRGYSTNGDIVVNDTGSPLVEGDFNGDPNTNDDDWDFTIKPIWNMETTGQWPNLKWETNNN